jgi:tetratricopeptide (TPR) repeat protein
MGMDYVVGATARRDLSIVYYKQNRYVEAEKGFARALSILEATFVSNHPWVFEALQDYATFLESYAAFLHNSNQQARAAEKEAQAKEIRDKLSWTAGRN